MRQAFVVGLLIAAGLAGCIHEESASSNGGQATRIRAEPIDLTEYGKDRPLHSLAEIRPFVATARDGMRLQGHVYVPDGDGPFPTILEYSPYHNQELLVGGGSDTQTQDVGGRLTMAGQYQRLLDAGYAVALVNIRGTGISQGCFQWGGATDLDDVNLVIETLASQPWSDGQVGMIGMSYPAWTQSMALANPSPHLKTVVPVSGVIDLHSLLTRNGAPAIMVPLVYPVFSARFSVAESTYLPVDSRGGETNHLECGPTYANDNREAAALLYSGDRNPYWHERDLRPALAQSHVPILYVYGLLDEGHILQFEGLWPSLPHGDKRAMFGQWGHGGTAHPVMDWETMRLAWFDQYMRSEGDWPVPPGIVEFQDDAGGWHEKDAWPPTHTEATVHLSAGSLVSDAADVTSSVQTFQSVDAKPCPGFCPDTGIAYVPEDARGSPACGPFQALYVSPPLKEDVFLAGNFHVNLTVTSTLPDGNFAAFLYRTTGDGACPDADVREIRRALTDLRHARAPGHEGADFPIGQPTTVNMVSHPFASPLKAGERLVLAIGGGSLDLTSDASHPVLSVTTGPTVVGQVTLPVVEGRLAFT